MAKLQKKKSISKEVLLRKQFIRTKTNAQEKHAVRHTAHNDQGQRVETIRRIK
jgi:hypothetical protein